MLSQHGGRAPLDDCLTDIRPESEITMTILKGSKQYTTIVKYYNTADTLIYRASDDVSLKAACQYLNFVHHDTISKLTRAESEFFRKRYNDATKAARQKLDIFHGGLWIYKNFQDKRFIVERPDGGYNYWELPRQRDVAFWLKYPYFVMGCGYAKLCNAYYTTGALVTFPAPPFTDIKSGVYRIVEYTEEGE